MLYAANIDSCSVGVDQRHALDEPDLAGRMRARTIKNNFLEQLTEPQDLVIAS
jgi:hypothetical protein